MKKIAILGQEDAILGFKALGLEIFAISNEAQAVTELKKIYDSNQYGILFITEDWMEKLQAEIDEIFADAALPAVVAVPGAQGGTGAGIKNIKKIVEQAIGSDILS